MQSPAATRLFVYLFCLNTISNMVSVSLTGGFLPVMGIIVLSAFIAWCESAVHVVIRLKAVRKAYDAIVIGMHNVLALTEYFLLVKFHMVIGEDVLDLLLLTTRSEAGSFVSTYLSPRR